MTQNERLLNWLQRNATISPMVAWSALGIYRLGARVFDLRKMGHNIISDRVTIVNRFGEDVSVASYRLEPRS